MQKELSKGEQNRQRIVEAADELFYHQGYNATSFSDIAEAAHVPRGNFYYYFKTKDDILDSVIETRLAWLSSMLEELDAQYAGPLQRLLGFADVLAAKEDDIIDYGCPLGTLNAELGKTQHSLQQKAARLFDVFLGWLDQQFTALGRGAEARTLSLHVLASLQGTTLLTNTYKDREFLRYEVARLKEWIADLGSS